MLQTAQNAALKPRGGRRMATPRSDQLFKSVHAFARFSEAMLVIGEEAPERMTLSQVIFFMLAATSDINGGDPTFSEIRDTVGPKLNRSLHTTYKILLEPSKQFPKGLGWLRAETSANDNRVKHLRVTDKGREVLKELAFSLGDI